MKKFQNLRPVKDIKIDRKISINDLTKKMFESGGFTAKKLAVGVDILERMLKDKDCLKFLSFPACIIATGTRGIIKEMIRKKMFDVLITTCGTLDHDLARIWKDYYHGDFLMDDRELLKKGINRLGNILVPNESYGDILGTKSKEFLYKIYENFTEEQKKKGITTHEFIWKLGELIDQDPDAQEKKEESIIYWSWKNQIPIIVPGPTDGSVGYQVWEFAQDHDFRFHILGDEQLLSDLTWGAKKQGALIIGGGISKHHTIWWAQFGRGLDYTVYMTTAQEYDGSLSGAQPREAVSWGKIKKESLYSLVYGDATITLPILYSAIVERFGK